MNQIDENSLYQNNIICKKFIETKDFLKDLNNFFITYQIQIQNIENIKKNMIISITNMINILAC